MTDKIKTYLFVCSENVDRSPTAEKVFKKMSNEKGLEIKVESAGLDAGLNRQVTKEIADNAYLIFVMESFMKKRLVKKYSQNPEKIISLNIPDHIYKKDDLGLVNWFQSKLIDFLY